MKLDYQALAKAMGDSTLPSLSSFFLSFLLTDIHPAVTPKAISHRISKIKEKAQVRRLQLDWEADRDNIPPSTPRKRGLKPKTVDDEDTDDGSKKRIKIEEPTIKTEENTYDDNFGSPDPRSAGDYFWPNGWSPVNAAGPGKLHHDHYDPYGMEEGNKNVATSSDVDYKSSVAGGDEDCSSGYGNTPT